MRWICLSGAYGLSTVANATNDKAEAEPYFSRMLLKSLTPEQLFESLMLVTRAEAAETEAKNEEVRLQGTWKLDSMQSDDNKNDDENLKNWRQALQDEK